MEYRVFSVPTDRRERYVLSDGFAVHLKHRGWTLFEHRPIYTDPQVIHQRWLRAPSGRTYLDRDFYYLFGEWSFRVLLRMLLAHDRVTAEQVGAACPEAEKRVAYIAFLHDQEMLLHTKGGFKRGPALASLRDIGHTLEWWCAEWLRRTFAFPFGQVPVRHGVTLTGWAREGDPGDLDVVAFLGKSLVLLECKTSLLAVDPSTRHLFFWRVVHLEPDLAVWLIDTPADQAKQYLAKVQKRVKRWQFTPVDGEESRGVYWNDGQPIGVTHDVPGSEKQSMYCRAIVYIALASEHNSLEHVLSTALQHYSLHRPRVAQRTDR